GPRVAHRYRRRSVFIQLAHAAAPAAGHGGPAAPLAGAAGTVARLPSISCLAAGGERDLQSRAGRVASALPLRGDASQSAGSRPRTPQLHRGGRTVLVAHPGAGRTAKEHERDRKDRLPRVCRGAADHPRAGLILSPTVLYPFYAAA